MGGMKEKKAHKYGIRPKLDLPMLGYLTHQYYFSNKSLYDLGFEFEHNDFRKATHDTIQWYFNNGWLPQRTSKLPKFVHTDPKPAIKPEVEYKTPIDGGDIF